MGISQVFPLLQLFAGIVALGIAAECGLALPDSEPELIASELGGFVVTIITGGALLVAASFAGFFFGLFLPERWFRPNRYKYESQ